MTNDARFSMRLPQTALAFGHEYAAEHNMTLSELLLGYLNRLQATVNVRNTTRKRRRPVRNIDKYIGIVKGAENVTNEQLDADRFKYLTEKYS